MRGIGGNLLRLYLIDVVAALVSIAAAAHHEVGGPPRLALSRRDSHCRKE